MDEPTTQSGTQKPPPQPPPFEEMIFQCRKNRNRHFISVLFESLVAVGVLLTLIFSGAYILEVQKNAKDSLGMEFRATLETLSESLSNAEHLLTSAQEDLSLLQFGLDNDQQLQVLTAAVETSVAS
jgi:hypothetical protein